MQINSIVLSAGKGTRMKSDLPKVVQQVCDYEMVNLVLKSLNEADINNNYLVVGYKKDEVISRVDQIYKFDFIEQTEQLGTGHAIKITKDKLKDLGGITVITCGDTPLVTSETFKNLVNHHVENESDLTILTASIDNPTGYGRIVRNNLSHVDAIVEHKDASSEILEINEINTGIYCFDNKKLYDYVDEIDCNNSQGEYYLTDLVAIFNNHGEKVSAYITPNFEETLGVNDLPALSEASRIMRRRINHDLMIDGVNIIDPDTAYISPLAKIATGTTIEPNVVIKGKSVIGENSRILSGSYVVDSVIGNSTSFGPNSHVRENSVIGDNCRIGNYVEIKKSTLGNDTKAAHLTYIGDSEVGSNVNFGCGVITANYDGKNKFKTIIGDNVFVGSNVNLIAPCTIGDNAFIAAGTTVTENIDTETFAIDRSELRLKPRRYND